MKISLLIPVYDYDIVALVHSMKSALGKVPEFCEILIGDDGSSAEFREKYRSLKGDGVKVISSEKNIGRAAIRNRLALEAKGDFLLFIDADVMLPGTAEAYILKWLPMIAVSRVLCGGTLYHESPPGDPDKLLRWKYGKKKEQRKAAERNKHPHASFSTFNVLIDKSVFAKIRFNEELKQYGHEDTLMGYQLKKAGIDIFHIDNGLMHEGLESNKEFLNKTKLGIENLSKLFDNVTDKKAFSETVRILRIYNRLRFFRLTRIFAGIFIRYRDRMEIRLDSSNISLRLFGFYKICMFCTYREIHRRRNVLPIF
ncbi:MAG: glycosyltransferase family A protein [Bacteroidales bacterium]|nr:glycosyltransferase family A protein [Bacteroidales bacterium]MDP3002071.1 glycosyltransferase family A protein [Bacteroidales bacterium]